MNKQKFLNTGYNSMNSIVFSDNRTARNDSRGFKLTEETEKLTKELQRIVLTDLFNIARL